MRKLLTIMLALLVLGGVVFGVTDANKLYLESSIAAKFNQGFHTFASGAFSTFNAIIDAGTALGDVGSVGTGISVELEETEAQPVGYYSFATNYKSLSVVLTLNPMLNTDSAYYVPYTLNLTRSAGNGSTTTPLTLTKTFATTTAGTTEIAYETLTVMDASTTATNAPKWASYLVEVTFNPTTAGYADDGLPQGSYTGTVVVAVTAS